LEHTERALLADLVGQLLRMVSPEPTVEDEDPLAAMIGIELTAVRPQDPALLRLFPDAYKEDETASDEFRRYTQRSLKSAKQANAQAVLDSLANSGDKIVLSDGQVLAWLGSLNDLRLVLGTRIGVTDDGHEIPDDLDPEDGEFGLHHIYDWLTYLQESLIQAMTGIVSEPPPDVL
jgi:hypothetical protein